MNRLERAAQREPWAYPFGTEPLTRLSAEEERGAPVEQRLRSHWPFIVRRAKRFCFTLSDRERAHLDAEDLVSDIVTALLEKDAKWDRGRGRYVTFCEQVVRNVLSIKREQARVVTAPQDAVGRLRRYRELYAEGTLSEQSIATMHAIEAALGDVDTICPEMDTPFRPESNGHEREGGPAPASWERAIKDAIRTMPDPRQAMVIAKTFGLFGVEPATTRELATLIGGSAQHVRALQGRAKTAIRRRIERLRELEAARHDDDQPLARL